VAFRLAVLVSGEGSNLQAVLDTLHEQEIAGPAGRVEVVGVASSREDARGLDRARAVGVDTAVFAIADHAGRQARDEALAAWLEDREVDLVVLAGFMELLGAAFIGRFAGRILNVHPSLLPAFAGIGAIRQAVEYGVKVMGVTVHLVDEGVDSGPVVLQESFSLLPYPRGIEEIEERVHEVEHRLLPRAIRLIAEGRVRADAHNPRLLRIEDDHVE
jgi:phosphoribosylglycinamide formyltransferase 1